jgi:hypothetical protein
VDKLVDEMRMMGIRCFPHSAEYGLSKKRARTLYLKISMTCIHPDAYPGGPPGQIARTGMLFPGTCA